MQLLLKNSFFFFSDFAEIEVEDEKECSSYLSPYQITTRYGSKSICAYISPEKLNWNDAKFHCNLLFAQLTQQIYFKSSLRTDLLKKGKDNFSFMSLIVLYFIQI